MKQVALSDFETFFESALDTTANITSVGALDSGSITSGFGNIDTGSSTITTTGLITGGSLDIDDVVINGTTIGHTDDTDLMTVANGVLTVAGEVSMTTLDIGGTNVTSTAAELNILDGVTATAAELNILDGVTSTAAELNILDGVTSTAAELNILDGVTATTAELNYSDTGASVGTVVASKVVTVDANKDVASFRNITLTGELDAGSLDVSGDADIDGTLEADAITVNGTALNTVIANEATALAIALG
jgi:cytoskeletal protein CcmA (bactofilin family)